MNFEIFKDPDPSGRLSKESYVSKTYPEEYEFITEYSKINNLEGLPFKEKVYLCVNDLISPPTCKNPTCETIVSFRNSSLGYREYCSIKCLSSDPNIKKIKQESSLKKFGTKTPAESIHIKEKIIQTNLRKWGSNSPIHNEEVKERAKKKLLENWGVDNPSKSKEILEKRVESFKKSNFRNNFRKTSLQKYGVEHPWMSKNIHAKTLDFFYSSYKERIESKICNEKYKFISFEKKFTTSLKFYCYSCQKEFNILPYQFYYRINRNLNICTNCYPISENSSLSQIEVFKFISQNYEGPTYINVKNIISPYEIDIFLPELDLGFEFNGVWWHSENFKEKNYHLKKIESSDSKNIDLITIWEDDWLLKREICESFILNKIKKTSHKIFARNCEVREVDYNTSKNFLDKNHLQGDCKSSVRIGLFHNGELVSLMTFSKLRLPLQKSEINRSKQGYFELTRFCNMVNTSVVGGASKLLKYAINMINPTQIETYSDNLISNGNLYEKLGFNYEHTSKPGFWYVIDGIRHHRFNWRKQKLIKMGFDPSKTEEEIMSELGYFKIFNAGNRKWILKF